MRLITISEDFDKAVAVAKELRDKIQDTLLRSGQHEDTFLLANVLSNNRKLVQQLTKPEQDTVFDLLGQLYNHSGSEISELFHNRMIELEQQRLDNENRAASLTPQDILANMGVAMGHPRIGKEKKVPDSHHSGGQSEPEYHVLGAQPPTESLKTWYRDYRQLAESIYGFTVRNPLEPKLIDKFLLAIDTNYADFDFDDQKFRMTAEKVFGRMPSVEEWVQLISDSSQSDGLKQRLFDIIQRHGVAQAVGGRAPDPHGGAQIIPSNIQPWGGTTLEIFGNGTNGSVVITTIRRIKIPAAIVELVNNGGDDYLLIGIDYQPHDDSTRNLRKRACHPDFMTNIRWDRFTHSYIFTVPWRKVISMNPANVVDMVEVINGNNIVPRNKYDRSSP